MKNTYKRSQLIIAPVFLIAAVTTFATIKAEASLLAYDGFAYSAFSNLDALDGGEGWASGWSDPGSSGPGNWIVTPAGTNFSNTSSVGSVGNAVTLTGEDPDGFYFAERQLSGTYDTADANVDQYLAYTVDLYNGSADSSVRYSNAPGSAGVAFELSDGGTTLSISRNGTPFASEEVTTYGATNLIVVEISKSYASSESLYFHVWLNPDDFSSVDSMGTPTLRGQITTGYMSYEYIGIGMDSATGPSIDELRVANDNFSDLQLTTVVPEPSNYAWLIGISALSLAALSRRRAVR